MRHNPVWRGCTSSDRKGMFNLSWCVWSRQRGVWEWGMANGEWRRVLGTARKANCEVPDALRINDHVLVYPMLVPSWIQDQEQQWKWKCGRRGRSR